MILPVSFTWLYVYVYPVCKEAPYTYIYKIYLFIIANKHHFLLFLLIYKNQWIINLLVLVKSWVLLGVVFIGAFNGVKCMVPIIENFIRISQFHYSWNGLLFLSRHA